MTFTWHTVNGLGRDVIKICVSFCQSLKKHSEGKGGIYLLLSVVLFLSCVNPTNRLHGYPPYIAATLHPTELSKR
ncbi:hypothetical protein K461DRAFT_151040 [Myriangium duriaei CBS 260.36]|uniref:Uncharacterized protein n=1 Tax=Myriangium duriaei CBS 260.36 TaxID=1168546 RepID=A0A9P4MFQ6_9PEZI|nr:hypothetical protein K461DRAFT_151040 [Myriangium duriaei CBS 260.36]